MENLFSNIVKVAKKESGNNLHTINDLFYVCKNTINNEDVKLGLRYCAELKKLLGAFIKNETNTHKNEIYNKIFDVLVLESRYSFDSYFQALEWNRPVEQQFYLPRRNTLLKHGVIQALEDLLINDKIDEMYLSMPPRVGKSTLSVFVITWIIGYKSERTNLYSSNSGVLTQTFYAGVKEILDDAYTYNWHKIFPNVKFDKMSMCSAKDTWLDTGKSKRFHSFTSRSIDGSLNGACDCDCLLIADDLVNGIEEALNINRLQSLWNKVNLDLLSRAKETAKYLWIGTRWSINDPIGIRIDTSEVPTTRVRNIVIPALDENDNSNFEYLYSKGFSSDFFRKKRKSYLDNNDEASWQAVYQGNPVEREGLLFKEGDLRTFNGVLPEGTPMRKFSFVDVAWGGGDYLSMPIVIKYDSNLYVVDWVFDSRDKKVTQPRVIEKILKWGLGSVRFEKNNGGEEYKDDVSRKLEQLSQHVNLTTALASNQKTKEIKIFEHAPQIREMIFLDKDHRSNEYRLAMENLCRFTIRGKNKNDDAPDSLAGVIDMDNEVEQKVTIEILQRVF